ncbi:MAG TPA: hypothetical protein VGG14_02245 [Candidatus Sulfotelmatobacter sp.]|jgi:hypothetical protein
MRAVATCLLLALVLWATGCSNTNQPNAQNDAGGVWQAALTGGSGTSSGFSFVVEFAISTAGGGLSVSNFQFLNTSGCFPSVTGATPSGTLADLTFNSADQLTGGTFSFTVPDNGNTLTLTSTGISGTLSGSSISGATITGTWALQGSGSGCTNTSGQFTMTQSSSTTASS